MSQHNITGLRDMVYTTCALVVVACVFVALIVWLA